MTKLSKIAIVITAAGSSSRIGGGIKKEFLPYKDGTVLSTCVVAFLKACLNKYQITDFIITCPAESLREATLSITTDPTLVELLNKHSFGINFTRGGATRQESVFNGLQMISNGKENPDCVLIHDGARPFVSEEVICNVIDSAIEYGASVPGITPVDTQKVIDENGFIVKHLIRKNVFAVQTPQGFNFKKIYEAHKKAAELNKSQENCREFTDDSEIWGYYYGEGTVKAVAGDVNNIKLTYPKDLEYLKDE